MRGLQGFVPTQLQRMVPPGVCTEEHCDVLTRQSLLGHQISFQQLALLLHAPSDQMLQLSTALWEGFNDCVAEWDLWHQQQREHIAPASTASVLEQLAGVEVRWGRLASRLGYLEHQQEQEPGASDEDGPEGVLGFTR